MRSWLTILIVICVQLVSFNLYAETIEPEGSAKIGKVDSNEPENTKTSSKQAEPSQKKSDINPLEIFQFANPTQAEILNKPSEPVKKLPDPEIDKLIEQMLVTMKQIAGSVGISANQIGKPLQISITKLPFPAKGAEPYQIYINPVITHASESLHCFWHGCLSAVGEKLGRVATWQTITVSAKDQQGKEFTRELQGLEAVIFQHEFRHLLGGGYLDHAFDFRTEQEMLVAAGKEMKEKKFKYLEPCEHGEKPLLEGYKPGETIGQYAERIQKEKDQKKKTNNKEKSIPSEK